MSSTESHRTSRSATYFGAGASCSKAKGRIQGRSVRFNDGHANNHDCAVDTADAFCSNGDLDAIDNDDSILDLTFALNDLNTSFSNYSAPQRQILSTIKPSPIKAVESKSLVREREDIGDFDEMVSVPQDLLARIELARQELEASLATKRQHSLTSLRTALQEGASCYLQELRSKVSAMKFNEKFALPISKEHERRRSALMDAISRAVVEEAKESFHCPNHLSFVDADLGYLVPHVTTALGAEVTAFAGVLPLTDDCRMRILSTMDAVKAFKLRELETEMQTESSVQVGTIEEHIRSRQQYWTKKTEAETVAAINKRISSYIDMRRQEVKSNVEKLRHQLEENLFLDLARAKAAEAIVHFNESVEIAKACSINALIEAVAYCGEVGTDAESADFPSSIAAALGRHGASEALYVNMLRLQKLLISSDLAKRKLGVLDR